MPSHTTTLAEAIEVFQDAGINVPLVPDDVVSETEAFKLPETQFSSIDPADAPVFVEPTGPPPGFGVGSPTDVLVPRDTGPEATNQVFPPFIPPAVEVAGPVDLPPPGRIGPSPGAAAGTAAGTDIEPRAPEPGGTAAGAGRGAGRGAGGIAGGAAAGTTTAGSAELVGAAGRKGAEVVENFLNQLFRG